jgi:hypothetical protein
MKTDAFTNPDGAASGRIDLSTLVRCSFKPDDSDVTYIIPIEEISVEGNLRVAEHEFPHVPGSEPEKLARKAYVIHVEANFSGVLLGSGDDVYGPNTVGADGAASWPDVLNDLARVFDEGRSGNFTAPNLPQQIRAYCRNWTRKLKSSVISGERATLVFCEDSKRDHLFEITKGVGRSYIIGDKLSDLDNEALNAWENKNLGDDSKSLFDSLDSAVNALLEVRDSVEAYDIYVRGKIERVESIISDIDTTVVEMQDPENIALIQSFRSLWLTILDLKQDVQGRLVPLGTYVTPSRMTVQDVAAAIYGDSQRTNEIMTLNDFKDPYSIPSGTRVTFYDDSNG